MGLFSKKIKKMTDNNISDVSTEYRVNVVDHNNLVNSKIKNIVTVTEETATASKEINAIIDEQHLVVNKIRDSAKSLKSYEKFLSINVKNLIYN